MILNMDIRSCLIVATVYIIVLDFKRVSLYSVIDKRSKDMALCQTGQPYKTMKPIELSVNSFVNIEFYNASLLDKVEILVLNHSLNCCLNIWLHDCVSSLNYNMSTCGEKRILILNISRSLVSPGDSHILGFNRNDSCIGRATLLLRRTDTTIVTTTSGQHITTLQPTITSVMDNILTIPNTIDFISNKINSRNSDNVNFYSSGTTSELNIYSLHSILLSSTLSVSPSNIEATNTTVTTFTNDSLENSNLIPSVSLMPTSINHTTIGSITSYTFIVPKATDSTVDYTVESTSVVGGDVKVENKNEQKDNPNSTIALGITVSLFALAVIIIGVLIFRVLYKTRKDEHVKADDNSGVFCGNDFVMHNPGFINEVPTAVATPDFIKIRKVSDSNTDEMMEVEDKRYFRTYDDSTYLGSCSTSGSTGSTKHNPESKYTGLSGYKKYPAPQPNKSSSYIANRNSRYSSYQSGPEYSQYKRH